MTILLLIPRTGLFPPAHDERLLRNARCRGLRMICAFQGGVRIVTRRAERAPRGLSRSATCVAVTATIERSRGRGVITPCSPPRSAAACPGPAAAAHRDWAHTAGTRDLPWC